MFKLLQNRWTKSFLFFGIAALSLSLVSGYAAGSPQDNKKSDDKSAKTDDKKDDAKSDDETDGGGTTAGAAQDFGLPGWAYAIPVLGLLGLGFTFWKSQWVAAQDEGTEKMSGIAANITEGAMSSLKAEYSVLAIFVVLG